MAVVREELATALERAERALATGDSESAIEHCSDT
jgi:hypothetical protein